MAEDLANLPTQAGTKLDSSAWVNLQSFRVTDYYPGGLLPRIVWYLVSMLLYESALPLPSRFRCQVLRWFGAKIGTGVVIKPHVKIKYPWYLEVGDFTWLGEQTWIDNFVLVSIGSHVCISQGTYFCTGSHDHRRTTFDLIPGTISIGDGAWIAARCTLLGGVSIGDNALVTACSLVHKDVASKMIVGGNPATVIRPRQRPS